eukprot:4903321-Pleurochrysis_carterae.AAC.1
MRVRARKRSCTHTASHEAHAELISRLLPVRFCAPGHETRRATNTQHGRSSLRKLRISLAIICELRSTKGSALACQSPLSMDSDQGEEVQLHDQCARHYVSGIRQRLPQSSSLLCVVAET